MSDPEEKEKRYNRRRNYIAKDLRVRRYASKDIYDVDRGERKGAFALKIVPAKKPEYKRVKLRLIDINIAEEEQ